jgi:hypothetical protein
LEELLRELLALLREVPELRETLPLRLAEADELLRELLALLREVPALRLTLLAPLRELLVTLRELLVTLRVLLLTPLREAPLPLTLLRELLRTALP